MINMIKNLIFYLFWYFNALFNYPNYLLEHKISKSSFLENLDMEKFNVYIIIKKFIEINNLNNKGIIVSLSGGVDSMVVLHCLIHLKNYYYKDMNIGCVCINYGIRNESNDEMKFLKEYLSYYIDYNMINDFIVMKVTNTSRKNNFGSNKKSNKRSEFEEESKQIRYDGYNKLLSTGKYSGVMLGHHKDDIIENIFTNMMYGRNILDLTVMKKKSIKKNITFYRPLLDIHKNEVYDVSNFYNIPFFKDTTPDWSKRGIMRRQIFPLFDKTFSKWNEKLYNIGIMSDEINFIVNENIVENYKKKIKIYQTGFSISFEDYILDSGNIIKKLVFPDIVHSFGIGYFGNKHYNKLYSLNNGNCFNLNKHFIVYRDDDIIYFIVKKLVNKTNIMKIEDVMNNKFTGDFKITSKYKTFWKNLSI